MPPVGFFGATTSAYTSASGLITVAVPSLAEAGDVLLVAIVTPSGGGSIQAPIGWALIAFGSTGTTLQLLFRHVVTDEEPAAWTFPGAPSLSPQPLAVLLLYRGLDPSASIVATAGTNISVASTSFGAPAVTLAHYSDLGLLLYASNDTAGTETFTMPSGATQRAIVHGSSGGTLCVADYEQDTTGTTGTKTATASSAQTGTATNIALQAAATIGAPFVIPDVPGAIGLPTVGV